ncbi:MAG: head-tail adaptor protein [Pseudomonadota bacterium]|nr:head-tail adaptor protein [Pseudomonadota bacterium]
MNTASLDRRVTLREPFKDPGPRGDLVQDYYDRGKVWANFQHRPSSEAFQQARLEARNPATVAVRASTLTRRITSEWRLEDDSMIYEVQGNPYLSADRALVIIQVEGHRK